MSTKEYLKDKNLIEVLLHISFLLGYTTKGETIATEMEAYKLINNVIEGISKQLVIQKLELENLKKENEILKKIVSK